MAIRVTVLNDQVALNVVDAWKGDQMRFTSVQSPEQHTRGIEDEWVAQKLFGSRALVRIEAEALIQEGGELVGERRLDLIFWRELLDMCCDFRQ